MQKVYTDITNSVQMSHVIHCAGSFLPQNRTREKDDSLHCFEH